MSTARNGWERARLGWERGGCGGLSGAPVVLGGGYPRVVSQRRPAAEFASDRRSLFPACRWPHPDAEARARGLLSFPPWPPPRSSFPSFLIFGDGRLESEEAHPRAAAPVAVARSPAPLHAHPARGWPGCREQRGVRDLGAAASCSRGAAVMPQDSGPASRATLCLPHAEFKSPGWGWEGKPLPPPRSSPPTLPPEVVFFPPFNQDNQTYWIFHS